MWQKVAKFKGAEYFRKALYWGTVGGSWKVRVSQDCDHEKGNYDIYFISLSCTRTLTHKDGSVAESPSCSNILMLPLPYVFCNKLLKKNYNKKKL